MRRQPGSALSEYGIIIALVGVAGLGALVMLGVSLTGALGSVTDGFNNQAGRMATIAAGNPSGGRSGPANAPGNNTNGNANSDSNANANGSTAGGEPGPAFGRVETERLCFQSGLCLSIPDVKSSNAVTTSGGLGADLTYSMANVLKELSEQLQRDGADPQVVQLVSRLANQGHRIGDHQADMWNTMRQCSGDSYECYNNRTVFDQTANGERRLDSMQNQLDSLHAELSRYLDENPNALSAYPEARSIIDLETRQISTLAGNVPASIGYTVVGETTGNAGSFGVDTSILNGGIVHQSANTICSQGGRYCTRPSGG